MFGKKGKEKTGILDSPEAKAGGANLDAAFESLGRAILGNQAVTTGDPLLQQAYRDKYGVSAEAPIDKQESVRVAVEGAKAKATK